MKRLLLTSYILLLIVMGTATIVERTQGSEYVSNHIYGAWWFSLIWTILAAAGSVWFIQRKVRRWGLWILHGSLLLILAGAFCTHISAQLGSVHLRTGEQTAEYTDAEGAKHDLPFILRLDTFMIRYHNGTVSADDYVSGITIKDDSGDVEDTVSMNLIARHRGFRLYQSSYDEDCGGSVFSVSSDPLGIPLTYFGYAILFFSLVFMLFDPKGSFRRLLSHPLLKRGALLIVLSVSFTSIKAEARSLPEEIAKDFGRLLVNYNERICPLQTYAIDFTKKLYGKSHYNGYSAEQVLTGWIFYPDDWSNERMIRLNGSELQKMIGVGSYASFNDFFTSEGQFKIGEALQQYYRGSDETVHRDAGRADESLQLIMQLRSGSSLRLLPFTNSRHVTHWYSPTDTLSSEVDDQHRMYISEVFSRMNMDVQAEKYDRVKVYIERMAEYQQMEGGSSLPPSYRITAELIYNCIPFATILFTVNLMFGFLTLIFFIHRLTHSTPLEHGTVFMNSAVAVMLLSLVSLTICLALRWMIRGRVPMGNGYETMLILAWIVQLLSLVIYSRFRIVMTFGFLLSGFFLLVSHISNMDPQINHLMPVLNSPLLSVHVSIIMVSYALISLTFICSITALTLRVFNRKCEHIVEQIESLSLLSRLFLYPALTTMGIGIFIGAIWANVSWGQYWSWDPKETWALITWMIYAIPVHKSIRWTQKAMNYHIYMAMAFVSLLMTYFGVNYLLGGMHSYA